MNYECKITVLETKVFPELQENYLADPKSGPCPLSYSFCIFFGSLSGNMEFIASSLPSFIAVS